MLNDKRYVNRDVEAIRADLYEIIKSKTSAWTDFNSDNFESHIIDLVAGVADMIAYYIDRSINETMLMSARQEKNIRGILNTMNYPLEVIGSAMGVITVERRQTSLDTYDSDRVFIPKWTNVRRQDDPTELNFLTTQDTMIGHDDIAVEIPVVQGDMRTRKVKSEDLKRSFKYYIGSGPIPIEWVIIDDPTWEKVEDAFIEINGGKKYSVHKDNKNRVYLLFTYDWKDYLPTGSNQTLTIRWIESKGTQGLLNSYELDMIVGGLKNESDQDVTGSFLVYNEEKTYGAYDSVDLNLHRANAKRNFKTMERIILLDDFEAKIREKPWVLDCYVCDWRKDITIVEAPHKLVGWVVTTDLTDTNQQVLRDLRNELMAIAVEMTDIEIRMAEYVPVEIKMNVCVKGNDDYREQVRKQVEDNLKEAFSTKNITFGKIFTVDEIQDIATRTASSVRFPEVTSFTDPIILEPTQYPNITDIEVTLVGDRYGQKTDN